jgi:serine/threonine protein kinase
VQTNPVAMHEFDLEHGMLCRINHPNIIRVLGAGRVPRRFIVLEYLGGGSLHKILSQNQYKPGLAQRLFHKPTFAFVDLLNKAKDLADALEYLHGYCHVGASVIHRGKYFLYIFRVCRLKK